MIVVEGYKRWFKCTKCGKKRSFINTIYPSAICCEGGEWVKCGLGNLDIGYDKNKDKLFVKGQVKSHINGYYMS